MQATDARPGLSILFWNLNGLGDKLCDPDMIKFLQDFTVIALCETWRSVHSPPDKSHYLDILRSKVVGHGLNCTAGTLEDWFCYTEII